MNIDKFKAMLVRGEGGCLLWAGHTVMSNGSEKHLYGRLRYKGKKILAHRLAFEIENGKIPSGMCVCHKCDNTKCCNPEHLFLGTHKENMEDMSVKGRASRLSRPGEKGEASPRCKLSDVQVFEIRKRRESGETVTSLSRFYGVDHSYISRIANGKRR